MPPPEYNPGFYNFLARWIQHRSPVQQLQYHPCRSEYMTIWTQQCGLWEQSVEWRGTIWIGSRLVLLRLPQFRMLLVRLVWSNVQYCFQFTLAKVVPNIEPSGWSVQLAVFFFLFFNPRYTRLPGQETTVSATRLRCSFNMGTSAEWLIPAVDSPLTATIMSPHLDTGRWVSLDVWD